MKKYLVVYISNYDSLEINGTTAVDIPQFDNKVVKAKNVADIYKFLGYNKTIINIIDLGEDLEDKILCWDEVK